MTISVACGRSGTYRVEYSAIERYIAIHRYISLHIALYTDPYS